MFTDKLPRDAVCFLRDHLGVQTACCYLQSDAACLAVQLSQAYLVSVDSLASLGAVLGWHSY